MNGPAKREALIFTEALGVPVEKRAAFLERACGGDSRLRRKVEALLASHEEMADFLEESPDDAVSQARIAAVAAWPRPTRSGDILRVESEIVEITPSRSKPHQGIVTVRGTMFNQNWDAVYLLTAKLLVFRRPI